MESYLPKKHLREVRRLNDAWAQAHYGDAKRMLDETIDWLRSINRDSASSLEEGLEETLAVIRWDSPETCDGSSAAPTHSNQYSAESARPPAESNAGSSQKLTGRRHKTPLVRRWPEDGFRKVQGYREVSQLMKAVGKLVLDSKEDSR